MQPTLSNDIVTVSVVDSISTTCPKMRRQQELVTRILMTTNRVFQGVSSRSQTDPESFIVQLEQPKRGVRIETALEEKWKSNPVYETKSSITLRQKNDKQIHRNSIINNNNNRDDNSNNSNNDKSNPYQNSELSQDDDTLSITSNYQVDEMFTDPIIQSIGRRSSAIARVLPTLTPSVCDSPVKLRFVSNSTTTSSNR